MKKFFTLIAVAMAAVSLNAQEKIVFAQDATLADGQEFTTDNMVLKLGNDFDKWKVGASGVKEGQLADFKQTVTIEEEQKDGIVIINGNQNPKDKAAKNSGSGFNAAEGKTLGNLPQGGTYFVLTTKAAGKATVGISLNADKEFYLIDATNAAPNEDATLLQVTLPESQITPDKFVIKTADGDVVTPTAGDKNGAVVAEKVVGTFEFAVEANHTYYFFCTGSKLGCFGVILTTESVGIAQLKAEAQDNAAYNLAGQKVGAGYKGLVIRNGRKYMK